MRRFSMLAGILLLTSAVSAQINLTGRELAATANGVTVGAGCVSSASCPGSTLSQPGAPQLTLRVSGKKSSPYVIFYSVSGIACTPASPVTGAMWLVNPQTLVSGTMPLGSLASGCPGAAVHTFSAISGVFYVQATMLTPGGQSVYTSPITIQL